MDNYIDLFKPSFMKKEEQDALPSDATVTMAYVPLQLEVITYENEKGLDDGTIFPALNKPFMGRMVKRI